MGDRFDPWGGMPKRDAKERLSRLRLDDSKPLSRRLRSLDEFPGISPNRVRFPRKAYRRKPSAGRRDLAVTLLVVLLVIVMAGARYVQQQGATVALERMRQSLAPGTVPLPAVAVSGTAPFSTEPRCAWLNDEAARLRSSGLSGGAAIVTANALNQKAAETFCMPGQPSYPSMQYVQADLFRLKDGEECRWARGQFLRLASMQPTAGVVSDAMKHREQVIQQGCYRY